MHKLFIFENHDFLIVVSSDEMYSACILSGLESGSLQIIPNKVNCCLWSKASPGQLPATNSEKEFGVPE